MERDVWTQRALFEGLSLSDSFVRELRRHKLVRVVGFDAEGVPLYGPEARDELARVMALVELGYKPSDISAIAGRVGLPSVSRGLIRRRFTHHTVEAICAKLGTPKEQVERWVAQQMIQPSSALKDGGLLFTDDAVELIAELWDLTLLGFGDEVCFQWSELRTRWSEDAEATRVDEASLSAAQGLLEMVEVTLRRQRQAARRWDKRLSGLKRILGRRRRSFKRRAVRSQRHRQTKRDRRRGRT